MQRYESGYCVFAFDRLVHSGVATAEEEYYIERRLEKAEATWWDATCAPWWDALDWRSE